MHFLLLVLLFLSFQSHAIINGKVIDRTLFPNVIAIEQFGQIFCSGVLISENEVLTAGHCIDGWDKERIKETMNIYIGPGKVQGKVNGQYSISKVYLHKDYQSKREQSSLEESDFAILKLSSSANYIDQPIIKEISLGTEVYLTGYGVREGYEVYHYQRAFGKAYMGKTEVNESSDKEFRVKEGESQSCNIDSGAPVYVKKDGKIGLAGITSRGNMWCGGFSVYGKVSRLKRSHFLELK